MENNATSLTQREIRKNKVCISVKGNSIIISGIMDDKSPGSYLSPFLDTVHKNIIEKKINNIEIDIRHLDYINSVGIKDLISWLLKFDSVESDKKYDITFICNKQSRWQGLSVVMIQKILTRHIYRKYA